MLLGGQELEEGMNASFIFYPIVTSRRINLQNVAGRYSVSHSIAGKAIG